MFRRLFGRGEAQERPREGKPAGAPGSVSQTLEKLDSAFELLEKREGVLEKKMEAELARAKQYYAKKNTQAAMQCMKRKKAFEEQLTNIAAQKQNLETLKFTLQNQNMNNELLDVQQRVKQELRERNKKMDADRVEDNMEELQEEMEKANAVAEALRQPLDNQPLDEEELMKEFMAELHTSAALEGAEAAPEKKESSPALPAMPSVPASKLPSAKTRQEEEEEEALRALEAELQS
ncbi:charged multivesicular body protein 4 [Trypanosoma conorhini]|uniref:Charged multivesicular body protein 4 n=1 Tax=Trypanosoma conorhini TaxID=83891 RepID=A0A422P849_9TRYP|nr:charged multivesicular body protein 4 [Trypanosoma conorhini]RNF13881.1 charged multivesicular body protein 4 [Trypanosoma conorhini]